MARTEKTEKKIQFQLSWSGLAAVAVSTICVLLWAFVLGFWSGKKVAEKNAAMLVAQQTTQINQTAPTQGAGELLTSGKPEAQPVSPGNRESQGQTSQPSVQTQEMQETKEATTVQPEPENAEPQGAGQQSVAMPEAAPSQAAQANLTKNEPVSKTASAEVKKSGEVAAVPRETKPTKEGHEVRRPTESKDHIKAVAAKSAVTKPQAVASKPETKPEAKTVDEKGGSYYALQIGAFKEKKHAEMELVKLDVKGYKAKIRVTDTGSPNGTLHRVYLGRFETPEEAKAFAKTLHDKDGIDSYVIMVKE
ncbi:MAG: SPOR domain-containing protein [Dissulfurimicrobium sp.]|uniref:SPOR domain-containing protein n=1 Tax=Dissulfurimicrobium sp. TaxID=2022436 RepID=UPI00404B8104